MKILRMLLWIATFAFWGCEKANEIYSPEEYLGEVNGDSYIYFKNGPVYLEATSWGCVAHIHSNWVNSDYLFCISEMGDAEGGIEIPVTSNSMPVSGLRANTQYYYCLYSKSMKNKTNIQSVLVPDVSTLSLHIEEDGEYYRCVIDEEMNEDLIIEKGFKVYSYLEEEWKSFVITGADFKLAKSAVEALGDGRIYAYVMTENGYFKSYETYMENDRLPEPVFGVVSEEKKDGVEYLCCEIQNVTKEDEFYFSPNWDTKMQLSNVEWLDDNKVKVCLKKGFNVRIRVGVQRGYDEYYSDEYEITSYSIYSTDDFIDFAVSLGSYVWLEKPKTVTLYSDIVIPTKTRLLVDIPLNLTLDGNGCKITGFSYFPLFGSINGTIKNLQIGDKESTYVVAVGTSSKSTAITSYPFYFFCDERRGDAVFSGCSIKAIIEVWDHASFTLYPNSEYESIDGLEVDVDMIYKTTEP